MRPANKDTGLTSIRGRIFESRRGLKKLKYLLCIKINSYPQNVILEKRRRMTLAKMRITIEIEEKVKEIYVELVMDHIITKIDVTSSKQTQKITGEMKWMGSETCLS